MHVVIVPSWYPSDDKDVGGSFFKEQAIALKQSDLQVTVAYVETRSLKKIFTDMMSHIWKPGYSYRENGVTEYRFRIYNILLKIPNGKEYLIYRKLKKLIDKIERDEGTIDLIHLHSFLSHGYAISRISQDRRIKFVVTEHYSGLSNGPLKKYQEKYLIQLLDKSDCIIAVGPGLKKILQNYINKDVLIIPNMVDVSKYTAITKAVKKRFRFLSVGALTHKKGFDLLIQAFKEFQQVQPDSELLIVGEGSERARLEDMINESFLEDHIFLHGRAQRDEIPGIMSSCHSFILTSRIEPFGVVLIEAMAAGKPVIATDNPGPSSIVTEETGILARNGDIASILSAMNKMFQNYDSYNADRIHNYCERNFSQNAILKKIITVYNNVIYQ